MAETSDTDYFEVLFKSDCRNKDVLTTPIPSVLTLTPSLWALSEVSFTPSTSKNPACGEIHYSIVGASSPMVTLDESNGKVMVFGTDKATDLGSHSF